MKPLKNIIVPLTVAALFMLLIQSCLKDKFDFKKFSKEAKWEPSFAVPIAHGRVTVYDAIQQFNNGLIYHDETGMVFIQYDKSVYSVYGSDIITVPDQSYPELFTGLEMNQHGGFNPSTCTVIKDTIDGFTVSGDQRLDSIRLKGNTKLTINVTSTFLHTGILTVTFPEMKRNGQPYSVQIPITTNTGTFTGMYTDNSLDDYSLDLSNMGTDTNKVLIRYQLTLNNTGSGVIDNNNFVYITTMFSNIDYYSAFGYMGYQQLNIPSDSVHLDMFNDEFDGSIYFRDPQIRIYTSNSYGLPVEFGFTEISAYSTIFQDTMNIIGTGIPWAGQNPRTLGHPSLSQVGQTIEDSIVLTEGSSNVDNVISNFPQYIFFGVEGCANPLALSDPNHYTNTNFILDTSHFTVAMQVRLPLWGCSRYFRIYDTVDVDMSEVVDSNELIENVIIRMVVDNGFPFEAEIQAYFADTLDTGTHFSIIDSLITG
ncbi:MAG: hypothetical protein KJ607_00290, partial [Bacteroidetes bacterium]|nr:hypothetical protein [Bacteroidota bacterium]